MEQLAAVRARIDATLTGSPVTAYKQLAHDVIVALDLDDTADELERVAAALKTRAVTARRRCRAPGSAASRESVAERPVEEQGDDMSNPPLRRRVIEYYGPPPDGDLGDPEDLNGDFDDEEDDDDHDLGAAGDPQGPGPR